MSPLPAGEPRDRVFEPAQAARRLGELVLPLSRGGRTDGIARRQVEACRPQVGERRESLTSSSMGPVCDEPGLMTSFIRPRDVAAAAEGCVSSRACAIAPRRARHSAWQPGRQLHHCVRSHRQPAQRAISEPDRLRPAGLWDFRRDPGRQPLTVHVDMTVRFAAGKLSETVGRGCLVLAAAVLLAVAPQRMGDRCCWQAQRASFPSTCARTNWFCGLPNRRTSRPSPGSPAIPGIRTSPSWLRASRSITDWRKRSSR